MKSCSHEGVEFVLVSLKDKQNYINKELNCGHEGVEFVLVPLEDKIKMLDNSSKESKRYIVSKYNRSKRIKIN